MNSVAEKSPEELLRMNRRGVKLKFPGSLREKRTKAKDKIRTKVNSRWIGELMSVRHEMIKALQSVKRGKIYLNLQVGKAFLIIITKEV